MVSHPLGRLDADEVELSAITACVARHEREPEVLRLALEHAVLVVEAVEVVGDANRVGRERVRAAALDGLLDDARELGEALDQLLLLGGELGGRCDELGALGALRRMPAIRACAYWT